MDPNEPFLADTSGPFEQLLDAEQTARSLQAWIQKKRGAIKTIRTQAIDQDIPYGDTCKRIEQLKEDITQLEQLLETNDQSLSEWRGLHMAAWKTTARPLTVADMPNEVLTRIFANFKDGPVPQTQVNKSPFDDPLPRPDLASIKNIRLTCRAFCEVASEVLLPVVDFSFSQSSIQRLEQISCHPTISKSVRVLRVHANPYIRGLINDPDCFSEEACSELNRIREGFGADAAPMEDDAVEVAISDGAILQAQNPSLSDLELEVASDECFRIMTTLTKMIDCPQPETSLDPYEDKISKAIDEARQEYERRFLEQDDLMRDPQALANVINAVTRMPNIQRFCIPDEGNRHRDNIFRSGPDKRYDASKYAAGMAAPNPFWELMVHGGYEEYSLVPPYDEPLLPLLHKLPLVLQVPKKNLTHLDINLPPMNTYDMKPLAEDFLHLQQSFQSLKSVHIKILETCFALESEATLAMTYSLLKTMLVSPRLEVIKLENLRRGRRPRILPPEHSIAHVLASLPWNNLRSLCLNYFSIKVGELRSIFQRVPGKIHLELSNGFLLEGTWAEALDILRGRVDSSSQIVSARGVEILGMSRQEMLGFRSQFTRTQVEQRDGWYADKQCPGPASFYVRGGNIPNPLIRGDDQQD